jgi:NAD(P)-dependent dehydrogenase (short-subunit alcohol dehydrogenase family)
VREAALRRNGCIEDGSLADLHGIIRVDRLTRLFGGRERVESFSGKLAVVTGAGSGIGRALAMQLAAAGARVALSDKDAVGLAGTLALLGTGAGHKAYVLDVSSRDAVFRHAAEVRADFGAVDYLFNNAGATIMGSFAQLSIEEIEWQLAVNLWGVIYAAKAFLPQMLERHEGCIVNISSVFGMVGFPLQSAYNISKFGVRGLTESLWSELDGTGVRAVSVHPGGIRTGIAKSAPFAAQAGPGERALAGLSDRMLVTPPEDCARDILAGVIAGKPRILTGSRARTLWWLSRLFPDSYPRILRRFAGPKSPRGGQ